MIIRALLTAAVLTCGLLTLPVLGAENPLLKPEATVHGPLVTLGDLIDGAGTAADVAVFRAPDLGMAGTVRADRIIAAAAANGLTGIDTQGFESVSVSRIGRTIEADEISRAIARHMVEAGRATRIEDVDIKFDQYEQPFVVEHNAVAPLSLASLDYDPRNGRFGAVVKVADSPTAAAGLRITGRAVEIVEVPVLARAIERGEIISPRDIVIDRVPRGTLKPDTITDPDRLTGMSARRALRQGAQLSGDLLMEPILVQRGDLVTIVFRSPGLTLTTRGRALGAGARGEVVQVYNTQSKRTVEAEVSGPGLVTVMPQGVPVAGLTSTVR